MDMPRFYRPRATKMPDGKWIASADAVWAFPAFPTPGVLGDSHKYRTEAAALSAAEILCDKRERLERFCYSVGDDL